MATGEAVVSVVGLTKRFAVRRTWRDTVRAPFGGGTATAVDGVSFDVREREVFGVLGQNGAGKTTIFKMLSTLVLPDGGTASVGGCDVVAQPGAVRRQLAPVIANERSLNWRLSAVENLRLFSALQGLRGAAARREETRVLAVVGLDNAGAKMAGEFSSGMRQRLLLARALIGKPRVLLLDEPTRSLDPISARDFRAFLRRVVVNDEGCTVLLATHDAEEVWDLCDRVGVLEKGRLLEVGRTTSLRNETASDRYRAWVRGAGEAERRAVGAGFRPVRSAATDEPDWAELEFAVPGGSEQAARLLGALVADGGQVARFERVTPSLADLIERVLARQAERRPDA
jgi:ABC-2 type transport system ATP-binding protein